jgi:threonine 3-dehydrogenase
MTTMRALVKAAPGPGLEMADVPVPEPGHNDVRIRVRQTSICGTDLHIMEWDEWAAETIPTPMVIGHEFMGVIDTAGSEVAGLAVGQRVSAEGHITCGHCRNCRAGRRHYCADAHGIGVHRPGAFAEYIVVPASNVFPVPDDIGDDVASILDPLGNATHTALTYDLVGEDVLITGAGPIGMMATAIVRHVGARHVVVTDPSGYRLDIAAKMGASRVVDPTSADLGEVMSELSMTEGFDVGLEMSGAGPALDQMIEHMVTGGKIALLGIPRTHDVPIDLTDIIFKGLTLHGIYGRRMFETWYKMTTMLQTGLDVTPVITHRLPAANYEQAFATVASGRCAKVIMEW